MKKIAILSVLLMASLLLGCTTVWQGTVTLTEVVNAAMKDAAELHAQHKLSAQVDAAIGQAHEKYRAAAAVAQTALIAYKESGDRTAYEKALLAVRSAVNSLVDMIVPLLTPDKATRLKSDLGKAVTL